MFGSMLSSLISDITTFNTNNKLSKVVLSKRRRIVGNDDQNPLITTTMTTRREQTKANKKRVSFETEPLVFNDDDDGYGEKISYGRIVKNGENNYNIHHDHDDDQFKVKILMTKEEAARLLAKCKDGGRLEFQDVAHELMQIPVSRVNLVSSRDGNCNFVWRQGIVDHKEL